MKRFIIATSVLLLAACNGTPGIGSSDESSQNSSEEIQETKDVMYRGLLEEAGMSVYMQGTHKLVLDNGQIVMLESDDINLGRYVDQNVEVFGSVRPTVEANGMIMRVESVTSLEQSSSSSEMSSESSSELSSEPSSTTSSEEMSSIAAVSSAAVSSAMQVSSAKAVSSKPVQASSAATSAVMWEASGELTAKADAMSKDKMTSDMWTQQYCSSNIGFCVPIHKNWWYKSFGTTSSFFWHVEIGPSEMNNLGEGPISINLVAGDISGAGMSDGQVQTQNSATVGMRAWTGNRHFEIRGPASLEAAIKIITEGLKATAG
jgi:hypothetical protein